MLLRTVGYEQEFNFELFFGDTRADAEAYLENISQLLDAQGLTTSVEVREGRVLSTILAVAAECEVHAIVMATHGRGGGERVLLGSNVDAVLHAARIPTLVIHPTSAAEGSMTGLVLESFDASPLPAIEKAPSSVE